MRRKAPISRTKAILGIAVVAVAIGGVMWLGEGSPNDPIVQLEEREIIYPTLYSDRHITRNAIVAHPRFKEVALAPTSNLLASILVGFPRSKSLAAPVTEPERSTWLWTPILQITPAYRQAIIEGAKASGIRTIYLSIDSYLDIYVLPDGPEKVAKQQAFDTTIASFIKLAHENGITVDAEGGWRNWAEEGHVYKPLALLEYVKGYNATHAEKFRGFQYDIEPYLLDDYEARKEAVLSDFLDLISETLARLHNTDLLFSVVIPDFYDSEPSKFSYDLRYGHALDHLLMLLERRPGSHLVVMAYRNYSHGPDGTIEISRREIEASGNVSTRVVIAQETSEVEPSFLTFYNTSRSRLDTELGNIETAFKDHEAYNGIAIHYLNALMALE